MKVMTQEQYGTFHDFFLWFKEKTDTDLHTDFMQYLREKKGIDAIESRLKVVCEILNIKVVDVLGKCRKREIVDCRRVISKLMRNDGFTFSEIGMTLGGRDHSTAINLVNKHNDLILFDKNYIEKFERVSNILIK